MDLTINNLDKYIEDSAFKAPLLHSILFAQKEMRIAPVSLGKADVATINKIKYSLLDNLTGDVESDQKIINGLEDALNALNTTGTNWKSLHERTVKLAGDAGLNKQDLRFRAEKIIDGAEELMASVKGGKFADETDVLFKDMVSAAIEGLDGALENLKASVRANAIFKLNDTHEAGEFGRWLRVINKVIPGVANDLVKKMYELQEGVYKASSPDRVKLVEAAKSIQDQLYLYQGLLGGNADGAIAELQSFFRDRLADSFVPRSSGKASVGQMDEVYQHFVRKGTQFLDKNATAVLEKGAQSVYDEIAAAYEKALESFNQGWVKLFGNADDGSGDKARCLETLAAKKETFLREWKQAFKDAKGDQVNDLAKRFKVAPGEFFKSLDGEIVKLLDDVQSRRLRQKAEAEAGALFNAYRDELTSCAEAFRDSLSQEIDAFKGKCASLLTETEIEDLLKEFNLAEIERDLTSLMQTAFDAFDKLPPEETFDAFADRLTRASQENNGKIREWTQAIKAKSAELLERAKAMREAKFEQEKLSSIKRILSNAVSDFKSEMGDASTAAVKELDSLCAEVKDDTPQKASERYLRAQEIMGAVLKERVEADFADKMKSFDLAILQHKDAIENRARHIKKTFARWCTIPVFLNTEPGSAKEFRENIFTIYYKKHLAALREKLAADCARVTDDVKDRLANGSAIDVNVVAENAKGLLADLAPIERRALRDLNGLCADADKLIFVANELARAFKTLVAVASNLPFDVAGVPELIKSCCDLPNKIKEQLTAEVTVKDLLWVMSQVHDLAADLQKFEEERPSHDAAWTVKQLTRLTRLLPDLRSIRIDSYGKEPAKVEQAPEKSHENTTVEQKLRAFRNEVESSLLEVKGYRAVTICQQAKRVLQELEDTVRQAVQEDVKLGELSDTVVGLILEARRKIAIPLAEAALDAPDWFKPSDIRDKKLQFDFSKLNALKANVEKEEDSAIANHFGWECYNSVAKGVYKSLDELKKAIASSRSARLKNEWKKQRDESKKVFDTVKEEALTELTDQNVEKNASAADLMKEILERKDLCLNSGNAADRQQAFQGPKVEKKGVKQKSLKEILAESAKRIQEEAADLERKNGELQAARAARQEAERLLDSESHKKTLDAFRKNLHSRLANDIAYRCDGMYRYARRDATGKVSEWTGDGNSIVTNALNALMSSVREKAIEALVKDKDAKELSISEPSEQELLAAIQHALEDYERKYPPTQSKSGPYPHGANIFGLDVDKLTDDQLKGLKNLVLALYNSPVYVNDIDGLIGKLLGPASDRSSFDLIAAAKRAIWGGELKLEEMTPLFAAVVVEMSVQYYRESEAGMCPGFGFGDFGRDIRLLRNMGFDHKTIDRAFMDDGQSPDTHAKRFVAVYSLLLDFNGGRTEGLDELCRRIFPGKTIKDILNHKLPGPPADPIFSARESQAGDLSWRAAYDPFFRTTDQEKKVFAMLRGEYVYDTEDDAANLRALHQALSRLGAGGGALSVDVVLNGVNVKLHRDQMGRLNATVTCAETSFDENGELVRHKKRKVDIKTALPMTLEQFQSALDDAVLASEACFTVDYAKVVFKRRCGQGCEMSSSVRQTCLAILGRLKLGTNSVWSLYSTERIVRATRAALEKPKGNNLKLLLGANSKALTPVGLMEIYEQYEKERAKNPDEVDQSVCLSPSFGMPVGETRKEARDRRLHEFVAELVQPNNTAKLELESQAKSMTRVAIACGTLVDRWEDLQELLSLEDDEIAKCFTLVSGAGKGDKLDGFAEAVAKFVKGIRALLKDGEMSKETLLARLRDPANLSDDGIKATIEGVLNDLESSSQATFDVLRGRFVDLFTQSFGDSVKASEGPVWQKSLSELTRMAVIDPDKGYGKFLKSVIAEYFTQMSDVDRRRTAAQMLRHVRSGAPFGEVLGAMLKGSGPILQKFLQGLPQSALPSDLQAAVGDLKCNMPGLPAEMIRAYMRNIIRESKGEITRIDVKRSLGSATVGQALHCVIYTRDCPGGTDCVIKLLRPDVQCRASRECEFFRKKIDELKLGAMMDERLDRILDEFDLMIEASNIAHGCAYDSFGKLEYVGRVKSIRLNPVIAPTSNAIALTLAPGETYDCFLKRVQDEKRLMYDQVEKITDEKGRVRYKPKDMYAWLSVRNRGAELMAELRQRKDDLLQFAKIWTEEVCYGSGFFHGDLHGGNLMTSPEGLSVIDYGNAPKLTKEQRTDIITMMGTASVGNTDAFVEVLAKMLPKSVGENVARLLKSGQPHDDLETIFYMGPQTDSGRRFIAALQYVQNAGVELPGYLFSLSESMRRLDEAVNAINVEMDDISGMLERFGGDVPEILVSPFWFDCEISLGGKGESPFKGKYIGQDLENAIKKAFTSRKVFEELMEDFRKLENCSYLTRQSDFRSRLKAILKIAERPDFLDKELEELRESFVKSLVEIINSVRNLIGHNLRNDRNLRRRPGQTLGYADIQYVDWLRMNAEFFGLREEDIAYPCGELGSRSKHFADVVSEVVSSHVSETVELVKLRYFLTKRTFVGRNGREHKYLHGYASDLAVKNVAGIMDCQLALVRKYGESFRSPLKFNDALSAKKPNEKRSQLIVTTFAHTLNAMEKEAASKSIPWNDSCIKALALYFRIFADSTKVDLVKNTVTISDLTCLSPEEGYGILVAEAQKQDNARDVEKFLGYLRDKQLVAD